MPTYSLWQDFVGPPSTAQTFQTNLGVAFMVNVTGYITHLRWWNIEFDNRQPDAISLYQSGNTTAVRQFIPAPTTAPSTAGWDEAIILEPVLAEAGTVWFVVVHYPGSSGTQWRYPYLNSVSLPTVPNVFTLNANWRRFLAGGIAYPTSADTGNPPLIDIILNTEYDPSDPGGLNPETVDAALSAWLHATNSDYPTVSTPVLTHVLATAINEAVGDTKDMVEALVAIGIGVKLGDAQAALDGLEAFLYSIAPDNLKQYLDGLESNIRGSGAPTIADVVTAVGNIPTATSGTPRTVGLAGWTQVAQTVGDGSFQWNQEADAYVFHTESLVESARFAQAVGEGVAHWFRGWAKPWDGANYYPPRIEVVGLDTIIHDGHRWPGIALWVPGDVEWTLTAYDYSGS